MELSQESIEQSLGAAFGDEQPVAQPAAPEPEEQEAIELPQEAVAEQPEAVVEPEFEIEVDGQKEIVRGADRVRELLQKGQHYSKNSEQVARVREQLVSQARFQQQTQQFFSMHMAELAELRAMDQALASPIFQQIGVKFESGDFVEALKLREQRDALERQRAAKFADINQKQAVFQQGQAQAAQQAVSAETNALLAKLPEWRNSEKAQTEKAQLSSYLGSQGYSEAEIGGIVDHRGVILARKAMLYDQLLQGKDAKLKQVRTAPPVAKPGVVAKPNPNADFQKFRTDLRKAGQKGNHRAQEDALTKLLNRTFK